MWKSFINDPDVLGNNCITKLNQNQPEQTGSFNRDETQEKEYLHAISSCSLLNVNFFDSIELTI